MGIKGIHALYHIEDETHLMPDEKNFDDEDVTAALARTTQDGPGFDSEAELPESDFDSFATDNVENDHDGHNVGSDEETVK
jgi:hypothetical protein